MLMSRLPRQVRGVHPNDLHVTLTFLGDCSDDAAQAAWTAACAQPPPVLHTMLADPMSFGGGRAWGFALGHQTPAKWITIHRRRILAAAGAPADDRRPRPHLTVGWQRASLPASEMRKALDPAIGTPNVLDRIALYCRADASPHPQPRYRQLRILPLRP